MARRYEYQVCSVQASRVTWVNGGWAGGVAPGAENHEAALGSCPTVWEYLQTVGYDGWELVAGLAHESEHGAYEMLYLKRER